MTKIRPPHTHCSCANAAAAPAAVAVACCVPSCISSIAGRAHSAIWMLANLSSRDNGEAAAQQDRNLSSTGPRVSGPSPTTPARPQSTSLIHPHLKPPAPNRAPSHTNASALIGWLATTQGSTACTSSSTAGSVVNSPGMLPRAAASATASAPPSTPAMPTQRLTTCSSSSRRGVSLFHVGPVCVWGGGVNPLARQQLCHTHTPGVRWWCP